jgi:hypothetical protein
MTLGGVALSGIALTSFVTGCGSDAPDILSEQNIESIVFIKRAPRLGGLGDIFQYTSYVPGAKLVKLTPPSADGTLEVLCCDEAGAELADIDIATFDIDYDAQRVVMSARLSQDQRYGIFVLTLATGQVEQLSTNPSRDYIYPVYLPEGRILFMTNEVVEEGAPQHRDEYERGTTTQLGVLAQDGTETLGARNLSHRVFPTVLSDGRVMMTQWDHLGDMNAGHLIIVNPDMTTVREAYGKEGGGVANSYLKAVEIAPGRVVTIATERDGTLQSGALVDVRLGKSYPCADDPARNGDGWDADDVCANRNPSEANSGYRILTPQVPRGEEPSSPTIGRYYDATPLTAKEQPHLLVSWADGPVDDMTLGEAGLTPDFGLYLFDSRTGTRRPIYNDEATWDIFAKPLRVRRAPPDIPASGTNQFSDTAVLMGSMNVYDSTTSEFVPGSVYGVRILEGFSSEEGVPEDFGLTEHEGSALVGIAKVLPDGSWAALIPANIPVHLQPIDVFGMALASEPVWISGRAGESRFCGGCHEDRAGTTVIQPGITQAVAAGPANFDRPRAERVSFDFAKDAIVGVPWGDDSNPGALQAIFDAKCVGCHDGDPSKPGNKSITIMDTETGEMQTITFDLRGHEVSYGLGETILSGYTASHLSLLGPMMMELEEENPNIIVMGDMPVYVMPNEARASILIEKLNPPRLYPSYEPAERAFPGLIHPLDVGGQELTEDEYHAIILMTDSGGQFYSRENAPGSSY